jgi:hypothetical protein
MIMSKLIDYDGIVANAWHNMVTCSDATTPEVQGGFTEEGDRTLCLRIIGGVLVANLETRDVTHVTAEDEDLIHTYVKSGPDMKDPSQRFSSFGFLCERLRAQ